MSIQSVEAMVERVQQLYDARINLPSEQEPYILNSQFKTALTELAKRANGVPTYEQYLAVLDERDAFAERLEAAEQVLNAPRGGLSAAIDQYRTRRKG